jgi:hypothetical protein
MNDLDLLMAGEAADLLGLGDDVVLKLGAHGRVNYFSREFVEQHPEETRATILRLLADVEEQRRARP